MKLLGRLIAIVEHFQGHCSWDCLVCQKGMRLASQCPNCALCCADDGVGHHTYSDGYEYWTDYGVGQGWVETVLCPRCGTVFEYDNGTL